MACGDKEMTDELRVKDADEREIGIKHPIILIGKVVKRSYNEIGIVGHGCRKPEWALKKLAFYNIEQLAFGDLVFVEALVGKKIKVTIEVIEEK